MRLHFVVPAQKAPSPIWWGWTLYIFVGPHVYFFRTETALKFISNFYIFCCPVKFEILCDNRYEIADYTEMWQWFTFVLLYWTCIVLISSLLINIWHIKRPYWKFPRVFWKCSHRVKKKIEGSKFRNTEGKELLRKKINLKLPLTILQVMPGSLFTNINRQ